LGRYIIDFDIWVNHLYHFQIKLSPERIQSFLILPKETQGTPISNPINNSNSGYNLEEFALLLMM
jgi:hypothetical protein